MFFKFHSMQGKPFWINSDKIVSIVPVEGEAGNEPHTVLYLSGMIEDAGHVRQNCISVFRQEVRETIQDIERTLNRWALIFDVPPKPGED